MMAGKTNQTTVAGLKKRLVKYHIFLHLSAWSSNRQPPPHQDPLPTQLLIHPLLQINQTMNNILQNIYSS